MEKYVDMKSPFTGGRVKEVFEQDTLQFNDLYSQYRIKHG